MAKKWLLVGSGGREHALYKMLKQSTLKPDVVVAPGNAGIPALDRRAIKADDIQGLLALAKKEQVDAVMVGPEVPLVAGIVDTFQAAGITIVGPSKAAARLEGSKIYCKMICDKYDIPTADYRVAETLEAAQFLIENSPWGIPVIKADGLCAGKGVHVAKKGVDAYEFAQDIFQGKLGEVGQGIVLERKLEGRECSVMALCDGRSAIIFQPARDYKRVSAESGAPNTGGMGAYSPLPDVPVDGHDFRKICTMIVKLVAAMAAEGHPYHGVLYAGIMLTMEGPMLLEFNCRFGDPETQVLLPRIKSDLVPALLASCEFGGFEKHNVNVVHWSKEHAVCVVMASGGYPGELKLKGAKIHGLDAAARVPGVSVYHAGTESSELGTVVTNGGRVLGVVGLGKDLAAAQATSYAGVEQIMWLHEYHRGDVGDLQWEELKVAVA